MRRKIDRHAIFLQNANSGAIQFREADARDAANQERDLGALLALGRKGLAEIVERETVVDLWRERFDLFQTQRFQHAAFADHFLQT